MTRRLHWLPFALCIVLFSRGALASEVFAQHIKTEYGYTEDALFLCTHCHQTAIGGVGTVVKPFGKTARRYGANALFVEPLKAALRQMEANNDDSDCDGIGDIQELKNHTDPNLDNETMMAPVDCGVDEAPRYGVYCNMAGGAVQGPGVFSATSAGVLAVLLGVRRRRRAIPQGPERQAR
jgi:hypothetical protein